MSRVGVVTITLDVSNENPTLRDIAQFIDEAHEHGFDTDALVDVTNDHLQVISP